MCKMGLIIVPVLSTSLRYNSKKTELKDLHFIVTTLPDVSYKTINIKNSLYIYIRYTLQKVLSKHN